MGLPDLPALHPREQVSHLVVDELAERGLRDAGAAGARDGGCGGLDRVGQFRADPGQAPGRHVHRAGVRRRPGRAGRPQHPGRQDPQHRAQPRGAAGQDGHHVERRGQRQHSPGADQAVRRPEAEQPARRGGDPDRAGRVGAEADIRQAGRHGRGRAGRRAAGEPAGILRIHRRGALAGVPDQRIRELVHDGQARHGRARGQQPGHRRCRLLAGGVRRPPAREAERGHVAGDRDHVLDRDRQAVQRPRAGGRQAHRVRHPAVHRGALHVLTVPAWPSAGPGARPARRQRRWWTSWSPYTGVARPACRALSCRAR